MPTKKTIKAIVVDNKLKRLRITFDDGSFGQLTFDQIEQLYGQYYLPDMVAILPKEQVTKASKDEEKFVNSFHEHMKKAMNS